MPLGVTADFGSIPRSSVFLQMRIFCSLLIVGVWLLHYTPIARKFYPLVGMPIVILPALFLAWMMYVTRRPDSPYANNGGGASYYAALNLILLAVSAVGHWSMAETFFAVASVIVMYLVASVARGIDAFSPGIFFNNLYFLVLTGVTVFCGNYLFNRLRFSEFVLRHELEKNRKELATQNQVLESTIEQLQEAQTQLVQTGEELASKNQVLESTIGKLQEAQTQLVQSGEELANQNQVLEPADRQAQGNPDATGADREAGLARSPERGRSSARSTTR